MRKRIVGRKFSRSAKSRRALLRALIVSLVKEGKITTTLAKSKEIARVVDKIFAIAKEGDLNARRRVLSKLANDRHTTNRIFQLVSGLERKSGFLKISAIPPRRGDSAPMAQVEILEFKKEEKKQVKSESKSKVEDDKADKKEEKKPRAKSKK
ncbi:MAG: hypothetical protein KatS3mg088_242 [Patescibacteria group bacterium]|nr:MAG: hypothetical protein KatS3mg088_242 [Patescibacteria group bacterium]